VSERSRRFEMQFERDERRIDREKISEFWVYGGDVERLESRKGIDE
jgi:hypothetical protein